MILKDSITDRTCQRKHQVMWSKDLSWHKGEGYKTFLLHLRFPWAYWSLSWRNGRSLNGSGLISALTSSSLTWLYNHTEQPELKILRDVIKNHEGQSGWAPECADGRKFQKFKHHCSSPPIWTSHPNRRLSSVKEGPHKDFVNYSGNNKKQDYLFNL